MNKYNTKSTLFIILSALIVIQPIWLHGGSESIYARNGMVVSTSMIASQIGRDILKSGGNAIDAAIATAFAMAVTYPAAGNIGGGGFIIYHDKDGTVTAFDFREKAPLTANAKMYLGEDGKVRDNSNHRGLLATGVPGTVAGLYFAHQRLGSKSWAELVEPAVKLARDGFEFSWSLHNLSKSWAKSYFKQYPSTAKKMLKKNGQIYQPNEIWRQPDLAETLKRIQKHGHDGFYKGKTAQILAKFMQDNGGIITEEDLAKYQAKERKPVHGTYRGYDIYSMCPPSSGGTILVEMLNILEGYDLKQIGHNSALYLHLLTEAMRRAYADRAQHLGDPDFNPDMPIDKLISKEYANDLRKTIDRSTASISNPELFNEAYESEETTHFSVIDSEGNAVSMTYTLEAGYGTKIVAESLGFFLNNEMGDFNAIPGLTNSNGTIGTPPNLIASQKRMLSSMTPTIVTKDGKPILITGSPGGRTIINTTLQVILNVIDHDMNIGQAVAAGRIHHQWLPDVTSFELFKFSPDTQRLYKNMGHQIRIRNNQGSAMSIFIDPKTGIIAGAADPRSPDSGAAGY